MYIVCLCSPVCSVCVCSVCVYLYRFLYVVVALGHYVYPHIMYAGCVCVIVRIVRIGCVRIVDTLACLAPSF